MSGCLLIARNSLRLCWCNSIYVFIRGSATGSHEFYSYLHSQSTPCFSNAKKYFRTSSTTSIYESQRLEDAHPPHEDLSGGRSHLSTTGQATIHCISLLQCYMITCIYYIVLQAYRQHMTASGIVLVKSTHKSLMCEHPSVPVLLNPLPHGRPVTCPRIKEVNSIPQDFSSREQKQLGAFSVGIPEMAELHTWQLNGQLLAELAIWLLQIKLLSPEQSINWNQHLPQTGNTRKNKIIHTHWDLELPWTTMEYQKIYNHLRSPLYSKFFNCGILCFRNVSEIERRKLKKPKQNKTRKKTKQKLK